MNAGHSVPIRDVAELGRELTAWSAVYEQMTPGVFEGRVRERWIDPGIEILWEKGSQSVFTSGASRAGMVSIGVLVPPGQAGLYCGMPLGGDAVTCLPGGHGFELFCRGGMDIVSATIAEPLLLEAVGEGGDRARLCALFERPQLRVQPPAARRLRRSLLEIVHALEQRPALLGFEASRQAMRDCVLALAVDLLAADGRQGEWALHPSVKGWLVRGAREYVLDHPAEPPSVSALCGHFGVSRRTLQYAFDELAGLGIVQFVRGVRLNGVRRELIATAADPAVAIADIAARWGFWHLPRFSAYYRGLFGELPSATRRRAAASCGR